MLRHCPHHMLTTSPSCSIHSIDKWLKQKAVCPVCQRSATGFQDWHTSVQLQWTSPRVAVIMCRLPVLQHGGSKYCNKCTGFFSLFSSTASIVRSQSLNPMSCRVLWCTICTAASCSAVPCSIPPVDAKTRYLKIMLSPHSFSTTNFQPSFYELELVYVARRPNFQASFYI